MKTTNFLAIYLISILLLSAFTGLVLGKRCDDCTTIQDGVLTYSNSGEIIPLGVDKWGYNYQGHLFNGWYHNSPRPEPPYTDEQSLIDAGKSTTWLVMKWSDEWLSNKDCDGDGLLDRGYSCNPETPTSSACDGAWCTNHQWGSYIDEGTGETCDWYYFVKIVYVNPNNAYKAVDPEDGVLYWYTNDGEKIGSVIWTVHARILQIYNDPCAGETGVENKFETPAGFGYYK